MAVSSPPKMTSVLNPNAPNFVPLAFRSVEDFSAEWWELVQANSAFRDYWLRERYASDEALIDQDALDDQLLDEIVSSDLDSLELFDLENEAEISEAGKPRQLCTAQ